MQSNNIIEFVQKLHLCMYMEQHVSNKSIYRLQLSDLSFWTGRNSMPQQQQQLQLIEILRAIRLWSTRHESPLKKNKSNQKPQKNI